MAPFFSKPMIAGFAWLTLLSSALAKLVPSFSLDYSSANATHVVVVDAEARVLESWRGKLALGQKIDGAPAGRPENVVHPFPRDVGEPAVVAVTGNRRVLFLTRSKDGRSWIGASEPEQDQRLATVWIEKGQCFAVYQLHNPGSGAQMLPLDLDEATLKARVTKGKEAVANGLPVAAASSHSDLAGEWHVFLPAGFEKLIKLVHVGANRYRLEPTSLNFGGLYEADDHRLTSLDQDNSENGKFVWRVRSRYLLTLTEQTGSHGSDYTGAVLFRRRSKVDALIDDLGSDDAEIRLRAMDSLRQLGLAAAAVLPELQTIIAKSEADSEEFRRAYTSVAAAPEHVRAYWAMTHIEASLRGDADQ